MDGTPQPPPPNPNIKMDEMSQMKQIKNPSLKLCFCPLCDHQHSFNEKQLFDWPYLARMIVYSTKQKLHKYFVHIESDIIPFIYDHINFFSSIDKFKVPQQQWTGALLRQFDNADIFILSENKAEVKLKVDKFVWEDVDVLQEISQSSNVEDMNQMQETNQLQDELRESYQKTLQIAKVAYLTCQKALYVYTDEASKSNIISQMEELQKVITETNYLLGFFQK